MIQRIPTFDEFLNEGKLPAGFAKTPIGGFIEVQGEKFMKTQHGWIRKENGKFSLSNKEYSDYDLQYLANKNDDDKLRTEIKKAEDIYYALDGQVSDLKYELKSYQDDYNNLMHDQEETIGHLKTDAEKDKEANRIGGELNKLNTKIEKIKKELAPLQIKADKAEEKYQSLKDKLY
ncbi:MAG: hypothetical protein WC979_01615 [Candidatus Pacearchaeota archaeon]|jgi:chromosome segregation ATPase|nr:hypothetical protein [Clostridia bacterium]